MFIIDDYDFYEIHLKWNEVRVNSSRGEVLGYRVFYWPLEKNDVAVFGLNILHIDVFAPTRNLTIKNLLPYSTYAISILAFTEGGFGISAKYQPGGIYLVILKIDKSGRPPGGYVTYCWYGYVPPIWVGFGR